MNFRPNTLLLSAGRRVSLARSLKKVTQENGADFYTADMNPALSAACQDNTLSLTLPHSLSPKYAEELKRICEYHAIGLIIPTIDTELSVLASLRDDFLNAGTAIIVSSQQLITSARDKRKTATFFNALGVTSPEIYDLSSPRFPAIAKPFDGSLSRDVHIIRSAQDLSEKVRSIPNLMLAEYVDQDVNDEFTCDAYYDKNEQLRSVVPRQRLEVRGGEVSKGRTTKNNIVDHFASYLKRLKGARGCLTFQFFRNRNTGELKLIELNARFGGGFPLSLAAGANYPRWLYEEWILGKPVEEFDAWTDSLTMLRYDAEVLVYPNEIYG